jgi:hypothetical protein
MIEVRIVPKAGDDEPQTWYGTFGVGQPYAGRFFVMDDCTYMEARERMFDAFGKQWAFIYSVAEWERDGMTQDERYGLVQLP